MSEYVHNGPRGYISRMEIEENSPSRRDGIDSKKEAKLRKSYCTFLQDLGMKLKVPPVTIATAIVFCHRFFLHQSHAKNDWKMIATVCMFLAGKVEEYPRPLKDVIVVSYEIIHKRDPAAVQRIKQKETLEQQKELILLGERVVLTTLGFDLNVNHPYLPLVAAIKKFKIAGNTLVQVAWNFVNDGLRTSLCLQYKQSHIAAGAIFLAAKFLKVKLPSEGEKHWWQEFDVTPKQLEDVSNQILELYDQKRPGQSSHANEGSASIANIDHAVTTSTISEKTIAPNTRDIGVATVKQAAQVPSSGRQADAIESNPITPQNSHKLHNNKINFDAKGGISHKDIGVRDRRMEKKGVKEEGTVSFSGDGQSSRLSENAKVTSSPDAITKIDKDRVKAALEKQRKIRNDAVSRTVIMDEEDLIERDLENGIVVRLEDEKLKQEEKHGGFLGIQGDHCLEKAGAQEDMSSRVPKQQISHGRTDPRSIYSEGPEDPKGELSSVDGHDASSSEFRDEDKSVH